MKMRTYVIASSLAAAASMLLTARPDAAFAQDSQIRYGPWQTVKCRPAAPPVGPGRGMIKMPQAPGGVQAQECIWRRDVQECPRIRDRARHPIQCLITRKQTTDWMMNPPGN